jgi:hypothetical protein
MNIVGVPADAASIVAAQAKQLDSKSRHAQKPRTDSASRFRDRVELRTSGVESAEAMIPPDSSQDQPQREPKKESENPSDNPHVDVKA